MDVRQVSSLVANLGAKDSIFSTQVNFIMIFEMQKKIYFLLVSFQIESRTEFCSNTNDLKGQQIAT